MDIKAIKENYISVLKKYVVFEGRATRSEYWYFVLVNFIISIVLNTIDGITGVPVLGALFSLAVLMPGLGVSARRLHDMGRSAWYLLVALIPLAGPFILVYFMVQDSQAETNQFGPNPKA